MIELAFDLVEEFARYLRDPANAEPAGSFPNVPDRADHPGLYAWWADDVGLALLSVPFGEDLPPLIYAGQAGATSTRSAVQSSATLHSRVSRNHVNGNVAASTFRATLTAVLLHPLGLRLAFPGRLDQLSNDAVSAWMHQRLRVAIAPFDDRRNLAALEHAILTRLDPPLNLQGMPVTAVRSKLRELRRSLKSASVPGKTPSGCLFDAHISLMNCCSAGTVTVTACHVVIPGLRACRSVSDTEMLSSASARPAPIAIAKVSSPWARLETRAKRSATAMPPLSRKWEPAAVTPQAYPCRQKITLKGAAHARSAHASFGPPRPPVPER